MSSFLKVFNKKYEEMNTRKRKIIKVDQSKRPNICLIGIPKRENRKKWWGELFQRNTKSKFSRTEGYNCFRNKSPPGHLSGSVA